MNYPEFREEFFNTLRSIVPVNIEMKLVEAEKNNGCIRYGISFTKENGVFSPTIYMEPFYSGFRNGTDMESLAEEFYKCYTEEPLDIPECVYKMESFTSAKPLLYVKMIYSKNNQHMLEDTPHIVFLDFAIVVYFEVESEQSYKGTVLIKKHHIDLWNVSAKEVLEWAIANTQNKAVWFRRMSEALEHVISQEDKSLFEIAGNNMYVLTNQDKYFGAVTIYYPDTLHMISKQLKEDFYLLPASIHEWVIVPASQARRQEELLSMVRDINDYEVSQEEILSYNVYLYCISSQKINILEGTK